MSKGDKRLIAVVLLVAVTGGGLLLFRHQRAEQAIRQRAADGSTLRGLEARPSDTPSWKPETP